MSPRSKRWKRRRNLETVMLLFAWCKPRRVLKRANRSVAMTCRSISSDACADMDTISLRIPHPAYDEQKLKSVKTEMRKVGPPIRHVVRYRDYYKAIDGRH